MGMNFKRKENTPTYSLGAYEDICCICSANEKHEDKLKRVGMNAGKDVFVGKTLTGSKFCICKNCIEQVSKSKC